MWVLFGVLSTVAVLVNGDGVIADDIIYDLGVKTSNWFAAGTDETVGIQLVGSKIDGPWEFYDGEIGERFETNELDNLQYVAKDIGNLVGVRARLKKVGWYLNTWKLYRVYVTVHDSTYIVHFSKRFYSQKPYLSTKITVEKCAPGYQVSELKKDLEICVDINECESVCKGDKAICVNLPGKYSCTCGAGYKLTDGACTDIDECREGLDSDCLVDPNSECVNNLGSYSCRCKEGFSKAADGKCQDIDECALKKDNCDQVCNNTVGSFDCSCKNGWRMSPDGRTCVDADECAAAKNPCNLKTSECYNMNGNFECICKHGYRKVEKTHECEPVTCKGMSKQEHLIISPPRCHVDDATKKGEHCYFSCTQGYELASYSTSSYQCSKDGYFHNDDKSKYEPVCVPTRCSPLKIIENGRFIIPDVCMTTGVQHKMACEFDCKTGYTLYGETKKMTCFDKKFNEKNPPKCVPIPEITCPNDVTVELPPDRKTVQLGGDYQPPITNLKAFRTEPKNIDANYEFELGTHFIKYIADNGYGSTKECNQLVTVVDRSPPVVKFCPSRINLLIKTSSKPLVHWPEPVFEDNVGIVELISSQKNDQMRDFSVNVVYTAIDASKNVATCRFEVHIDYITCSFDQMKGGDQGINKMCQYLGMQHMCRMDCPAGKTLYPLNPASFMMNSWFCKEGDWKQMTVPVKVIPDCVDFVSVVSGKCPDGSMATLNYRTRQNVCGKCPRGTKYNNGQCISCPVNHYQNEEGQLTCKKCPHGTASRVTRSVNNSTCEKLCGPGTFSRDGFENKRTGQCKKCPRNTYNVNFGAKECIRCPIGTMTEQEGIADSADCQIIKDMVFPVPEVVTVTEGEKASLACIINSGRNLTFGWKMPCRTELISGLSFEIRSNNQTLPLHKNDYQSMTMLAISNVKQNYNGLVFTCKAQYVGPTKVKEGSVKLVVKSKQ